MSRPSPALLVVLALAACSKAPDPSGLPADINEALRPAFLAAFGREAPAPHDVVRGGRTLSLAFSPKAIDDLGDGEAALVSLAAPDGGCNGCDWAVAVHYLKARDNRFTVDGSWFDVAPQGPLDDPPRLRIRGDLFDRPALASETPRRDRGCETSVVTLFELLPSGPRLRARDIPTERSNIPMGALRLGPQVDLYGNVIADAKGRTFKVHYHGTTEGDVIWTPGADGMWRASGGVTLPAC
jgi:hypothetical protein